MVPLGVCSDQRLGFEKVLLASTFLLYWMFYTVVIFNIIDYFMPFQFGSNVPYFMHIFLSILVSKCFIIIHTQKNPTLLIFVGNIRGRYANLRF